VTIDNFKLSCQSTRTISTRVQYSYHRISKNPTAGNTNYSWY